MRHTHWFGETVHHSETTLAELTRQLPTFTRAAFGRTRRDVIRLADKEPVPVALVSKRYVLVQHAEAIAGVVGEIDKAGIDPSDVTARLALSENGTRMALSVILPDEYAFTPPDGHTVGLTFECYNSVDGTVPFLATVGWLRFVCSNGLVVGTAAVKVRQRHSAGMNIGDISTVLASGTKAALGDRRLFVRWLEHRIDPESLAGWVDGAVTDTWGPTAAARVHNIVTRGHDGRPAARPRTQRPSQRPLNDPIAVPGSEPCEHAYGCAQALSWVASRRNNLAERIVWRDQIPELMHALEAIGPSVDAPPPVTVGAGNYELAGTPSR